jgi:hypothetical protein
VTNTPGDTPGAGPLGPELPPAAAPAAAPSGAKTIAGRGARRHGGSPRGSHHWLAFGGLGLLVVIVGLGVAVFLLAWPHASLTPTANALGEIQTRGVAEHVVGADASYGGHEVALSDHGGVLLPDYPLPMGTPVTVTVELRRPAWIGWAAGRTTELSEHLVTPSTSLLQSVALASPGHAVQVNFSAPVKRYEVVAAGKATVADLSSPSTTVTLLNHVDRGVAGAVMVAAVPETWESLPALKSVTYFGTVTTVADTGTLLYLSPDLATTALGPSTAIHLVFSHPIAKVLGKLRPRLVPTIGGALEPQGSWTEPTPYSLIFHPTGVAFWPGTQYNLELPAPVAVIEGGKEVSASTETVSMHTATGSMLRLQQLLAILHYLPVSWTPAAPSGNPTTLAGQVALAYAAPAGSFAWRWTMPATLEDFWTPGSYSVMTRGALMAFEHVEGLNDSPARSNPLLWPYLIKAVLGGRTDPHPYVWIDVTKTLPETLHLWSNGKIIITSLANTGIPQDPTENGTFPVYLRFAQNYMSGYNPNGTYYHDLVFWISYFNGGDAVHGFPRYSYGFPQSLGCVELPVAGYDPISEQVWGYDHIGTLVTVQN